MASPQQQCVPAFTDAVDILGALTPSEPAINDFDLTGYTTASSFMASSSNALVPVSVPAFNNYTMSGQLQPSDWPPRLPDRQTTRHLCAPLSLSLPPHH